jgi:hypothetical protein
MNTEEQEKEKEQDPETESETLYEIDEELVRQIQEEYNPSTHTYVDKLISEWNIPAKDIDTIKLRLRNVKFDLDYEGDWINVRKEFKQMYKTIYQRNPWLIKEVVYLVIVEKMLYAIAQNRLGQYKKSYISAEEI